MHSGDLSTQWDLVTHEDCTVLDSWYLFFRLLFCIRSCCCLLSFNMHLYFVIFSSISFGISIGNRQLVAKRIAVILYNCIAWWLMFDWCNTLHVTGSNCWRVAFILFDCWASGLIVWNRFQVFIFHTALKCTADSRSAINLCNSCSYWDSQMLIWCKVRVISSTSTLAPLEFLLDVAFSGSTCHPLFKLLAAFHTLPVYLPLRFARGRCRSRFFHNADTVL